MVTCARIPASRPPMTASDDQVLGSGVQHRLRHTATNGIVLLDHPRHRSAGSFQVSRFFVNSVLAKQFSQPVLCGFRRAASQARAKVEPG